MLVKAIFIYSNESYRGSSITETLEIPDYIADIPNVKERNTSAEKSISEALGKEVELLNITPI